MLAYMSVVCCFPPAGDVIGVAVAPAAGCRRASAQTQLPYAASLHDCTTAASRQRRPTVAHFVSAIIRRLQRHLLAHLHALTSCRVLCDIVQDCSLHGLIRNVLSTIYNCLLYILIFNAPDNFNL